MNSFYAHKSEINIVDNYIARTSTPSNVVFKILDALVSHSDWRNQILKNLQKCWRLEKLHTFSFSANRKIWKAQYLTFYVCENKFWVGASLFN